MKRNIPRALILATTCLVPLTALMPLPARADDFSVNETAEPPPLAIPEPGSSWFMGSMDLGLGGSWGHNAGLAGRYNGNNATGVNGGITDLNLRGGSAWSSGGTRYFTIDGTNLNILGTNELGRGIGSNGTWATSINNKVFNEGSLSVRIGDQGIWGFGAFYDSTTYTGNVIDSLYTVNGGVGTLNNGLAPWGGATKAAKGAVTAFTIPQLLATGAMQPAQTGTRRDTFGTDFKWQWNDWTFSGAFRHEEKQGSMEESFDGPWGGTAFTAPVSFVTERYDAQAAYNTRELQAIFQYTFSHFVNSNLYVSLPYPTSNTAVPYQRTAAYSLPPSNDAHYFTAMIADRNLIPKTTVNLNARVGWELQDHNFAPNSADPNPAGGAGYGGLLQPNMVGTTATTPDIQALVYQFRLSAASRPMKDVDTRVFYGMDGRNVNLNQYQVNVGGTGGAAADGSFSGTAFVVPQTWLKQNAGVEVGYRILPETDTKLTAGYRFDSVERSNAQAGHSYTNTANVGVMSQLADDLDGKVTFEYADRSAKLSYLTAWENLQGSPGGQTYSGAYYQSPMTSESVTLRADYAPPGPLSSSLLVQFKNENYSYPNATPVGTATVATATVTGTGQGVKQDYALTVGPDLTYRPSKDMTFHAFYDFEMLFYSNTGNGACSTPATVATAACAGSIGYFRNNQTSVTHTVGVSADWQVNDKLTIRGDYTLSYGSVMFSQFNGVFVANPTASYQNVANYPDINSLMNSVRVTATYKLFPNCDLLGMVAYTAFHNNDWADQANAIQGNGSTSISILTPGYTSPNYAVASAMAGLRLRF